jgi:hypothetical protein
MGGSFRRASYLFGPFLFEVCESPFQAMPNGSFPLLDWFQYAKRAIHKGLIVVVTFAAQRLRPLKFSRPLQWLYDSASFIQLLEGVASSHRIRWGLPQPLNAGLCLVVSRLDVEGRQKSRQKAEFAQ